MSMEKSFALIVYLSALILFFDLVRFRILVLQPNLVPFDNALDVFIIDPGGLIVRRWLSIYTNNGVSSLKFRLPKLAKDGIWNIRTKIQSQIDEKNITVETYFQPFFEVIITMHPYVIESEDEITAEIFGMFTSQKFVRGNATIIWSGRKYKEETEFSELLVETIFIKEEKHQVSLPLKRIKTVLDEVVDTEIKLWANLTDFLSGITVSGYSHSRIITKKLQLRFLTPAPAVFVPGMPLDGHVYVVISYEDGEHIPETILEKSVLTIKVEGPNEIHDIPTIEINEMENAAFPENLIKDDLRSKYLEDGIVPYHFDVPESIVSSTIYVTATYTNIDITISEKLTAVKSVSVEDHHLKIWTTSESLVIGDYVTLHVKSNFRLMELYYMILSKNLVLRAGNIESSEDNPLTLTTFSIPVSADMAPLFHIIIYYITNLGDMVSDAVTIPVNGFARYETTMEVNLGKDYKAEKVEAIASGGEGAFIGMQAIRSSVYQMQAGNEITHSLVTDSFVDFETNFRAIRKVSWVKRDGLTARQSIYFPSNDYTYDSASCFKQNDLIVSTDLKLQNDLSADDYDCSVNVKKDGTKFADCLTIQCFPVPKKCNITVDCKNASEESHCSKSSNEDYMYRIFRSSRNSTKACEECISNGDHYDAGVIIISLARERTMQWKSMCAQSRGRN